MADTKKQTGKKVAKKVTKKRTRRKNLVIVESPAKARTIARFLGSSYKVVASVGHVRDLPKSRMGIKIDEDFEPEYISIRGKGDIIKMLKQEAKKAKKVYLATDPDREGEAISWHIAHLLDIPEDEECRVEFNEITKDTVKEAIKHPRKIDMRLVDAQQARRILDRLVGYSISPLLWRKVRRGLSAGRVQSAALKMICDREDIIDAFVPEEYWNIYAQFDKQPPFEAKLEKKDGKDFKIKDEKTANKVVDELKSGQFQVKKVDSKQSYRRPSPPFTTSTLQQEASNKLGFRTKRTMMIAQQLYEGINVPGKGTVGLITYMRTDSVRISDLAMAAAKGYIVDKYGPKYHKAQVFEKKGGAQDAHEAIRPSYVDLAPNAIKESLTDDQYRLYKLIWSRFIASQMTAARLENVTAIIENGAYNLKAAGSRQLFDGYRKVYSYVKQEEKILPKMEDGELLACKDVRGEQKFTQPMPRYTEASLIEALEKEGIGRPSTYAPIVGTLGDRRYIKRERKSLLPTDLGKTVNTLMAEHFKDIVDLDFTSDLEDKLDEVGYEIKDWKDVLRKFYRGFEKDLKMADEKIEKLERKDELTDELCEKCGGHMVKKLGRYGEFLACQNYPECKNTKAIVIGTGVACPSCGKELVQRRSKRGRIFYGCSGYPACKQSYWYKPSGEKCPECGSMLLIREGKRFTGLSCSNEDCKYRKKQKVDEGA